MLHFLATVQTDTVSKILIVKISFIVQTVFFLVYVYIYIYTHMHTKSST